tara:strand:- start:45 stop:995 length:951 start_codon:yes stop_codon:yes gene_type:complete
MKGDNKMSGITKRGFTTPSQDIKAGTTTTTSSSSSSSSAEVRSDSSSTNKPDPSQMLSELFIGELFSQFSCESLYNPSIDENMEDQLIAINEAIGTLSSLRSNSGSNSNYDSDSDSDSDSVYDILRSTFEKLNENIIYIKQVLYNTGYRLMKLSKQNIRIKVSDDEFLSMDKFFKEFLTEIIISNNPPCFKLLEHSRKLLAFQDDLQTYLDLIKKIHQTVLDPYKSLFKIRVKRRWSQFDDFDWNSRSKNEAELGPDCNQEFEGRLHSIGGLHNESLTLEKDHRVYLDITGDTKKETIKSKYCLGHPQPADGGYID